MGDMRDGHSLLSIGPSGTIRWRADYGGAANYTMFPAKHTYPRRLAGNDHPVSDLASHPNGNPSVDPAVNGAQH